MAISHWTGRCDFETINPTKLVQLLEKVVLKLLTLVMENVFRHSKSGKVIIEEVMCSSDSLVVTSRIALKVAEKVIHNS